MFGRTSSPTIFEVNEAGHLPEYIERSVWGREAEDGLLTQPLKSLLNRSPRGVVPAPLGFEIAKRLGDARQIFIGIPHPKIDVEGENGLMPQKKIHPPDENRLGLVLGKGLQDRIDIHGTKLGRVDGESNLVSAYLYLDNKLIRRHLRTCPGPASADMLRAMRIPRPRFLHLFLGAIFLLALARTVFADDSSPLVIGMELNYPPFEMTDPQGNPAGVGVDLAKALGVFIHRPISIQNMPFEGLIPALKTGRIDLIISSMTATDERRRSIDFSDPYLSTGLSILVKKGSPIQSIADVDKPGVTVTVKTGTTAANYARDHFKNATVLTFQQDSACALEVAQGKADAFLYDQMSIYQFAKKFPDTTRGLLAPFQKESWAIGIRKGNVALENQVNAFLRDFKAKHGFDALGDKYFKTDKEAFRQMGFPFYF
jgi:polar amino acid transport system substrate-binding protein